MSACAWKTINTTLGQNVCWFCENKFEKGKVKKMFMISQVLDYFKSIQNQIVQFNSQNLKECHIEFLQYNGDAVAIIENMKKCQIEPWMSGLACSVNKDCSDITELILSIAPSASISIQSNTIPRDPKDCPPGCGCDNPWTFMTSK